MKFLRGFLSVLSLLALTTLFVACPLEIDISKPSESVNELVYQLSQPTNLQAVPRDGFVYLTWDPVYEAQEYAVYRSLPTQAGVDANSDTAFSLIGIVKARDKAFLYDGTRAAATVGGGCTYLDYVNLENPLKAGTYKYAVMALREEVDLVKEFIPFIDGNLSSPISVTLASVPPRSSVLPAPENFKVESFGFGQFYNLSWDLAPLADSYTVFTFDPADLDDIYAALAQTDPQTQTEILMSLIVGAAEDDEGSDIIEIEEPGAWVDAQIWGEMYGVIAHPRDKYFNRFSSMAFQDIPEQSLDAPPHLTATDNHEDEIILEFEAVYGAENYEIWRSNTGYGNWDLLDSGNDMFEYINTLSTGLRYHDRYELEAGAGGRKYYHYKVRAVSGSGDNLEVSPFTNIARGAITPLAGEEGFGGAGITDLKATDGLFENKIELTWSKVKDADQYLIYRADETEGDDSSPPVYTGLNYNLLAGPIPVESLEAGYSTLFWEDFDVEAGVDVDSVPGTKYYCYKVVAVNTKFGINADKTVYSPFSNEDWGHVAPNEEVTTITYVLPAPATVQYYGQGEAATLRVQWTEVKEDLATGSLTATGYEVYYSTAKDGEYTLVATTNVNLTTINSVVGTSTKITPNTGFDYGISLSYTGDYGLKRGVKYYFRIKSLNSTHNMVSVLSDATPNWLDGLDPSVITGSFAQTSNIGTISGDLNVSMTEAVTGATAYTLYVSTNSNLKEETPRILSESVTEDDLLSGDFKQALSGLAGNTTYYYGIYAASATAADAPGVIGEESYPTSASSFRTGNVQ